MAAGTISTTAFVVNLPLLQRGQRLHEALTDDGYPTGESLVASAVWMAVARLSFHDLPEYVPTTSTATEEIREFTKMRVMNRVYIINIAPDSLTERDLPFVQHWKIVDGVPLRALVMTHAIHNLPETPANTLRVTLQDYVLQAPCEAGLAICNALLMAIPMRGKGTGRGAARARVRQWNIFTRQIDGLRSVVHTVAARLQEGKTGPVPSVEVKVGHLHTV